MIELPLTQQHRIVRALNKAGADQPCPRCGNNGFTLLNGYVSEPIQADTSNVLLGGPTIPTVITVCNQCGYMSQHAMGALGLLPPATE